MYKKVIMCPNKKSEWYEYVGSFSVRGVYCSGEHNTQIGMFVFPWFYPYVDKYGNSIVHQDELFYADVNGGYSVYSKRNLTQNDISVLDNVNISVDNGRMIKISGTYKNKTYTVKPNGTKAPQVKRSECKRVYAIKFYKDWYKLGSGEVIYEAESFTSFTGNVCLTER
jgi:hypothetical protein